jgi:hypothetical protein
MLLTAHTLKVKLAKVHLLGSVSFQSDNEFCGNLGPEELVKVPASDKFQLANDEDRTNAPTDGQANIALFKHFLIFYFLQEGHK